MCELEWNIDDGLDQWHSCLCMPEFEPQEDILNIHCNKLVKTLLIVIN